MIIAGNKVKYILILINWKIFLKNNMNNKRTVLIQIMLD